MRLSMSHSVIHVAFDLICTWADPGFQVRGGAQFRWSKSASFTSRGWWEGGDGLGDLDIDIVGVLF